MGDEFVGEDGGVSFDLYEVDGYGGYFGEDGAPEGVGEGEVCVAEFESYVGGTGLGASDGLEVRVREELLLGLLLEVLCPLDRPSHRSPSRYEYCLGAARTHVCSSGASI